MIQQRICSLHLSLSFKIALVFVLLYSVVYAFPCTCHVFSIITIFSVISNISWSHIINLINWNHLHIRKNAINNLELNPIFRHADCAARKKIYSVMCIHVFSSDGESKIWLFEYINKRIHQGKNTVRGY